MNININKQQQRPSVRWPRTAASFDSFTRWRHGHSAAYRSAWRKSPGTEFVLGWLAWGQTADGRLLSVLMYYQYNHKHFYRFQKIAIPEDEPSAELISMMLSSMTKSWYQCASRTKIKVLVLVLFTSLVDILQSSDDLTYRVARDAIVTRQFDSWPGVLLRQTQLRRGGGHSAGPRAPVVA